MKLNQKSTTAFSVVFAALLVLAFGSSVQAEERLILPVEQSCLPCHGAPNLTVALPPFEELRSEMEQIDIWVVWVVLPDETGDLLEYLASTSTIEEEE